MHGGHDWRANYGSDGNYVLDPPMDRRLRKKSSCDESKQQPDNLFLFYKTVIVFVGHDVNCMSGYCRMNSFTLLDTLTLPGRMLHFQKHKKTTKNKISDIFVVGFVQI